MTRGPIPLCLPGFCKITHNHYALSIHGTPHIVFSPHQEYSWVSGITNSGGNLCSSYSSIWSNVVKTGHNLDKTGVEFTKSFKRKIRNGKSTLFWYDTWISNTPLYLRFKRLFRLEKEPYATVQSRLGWDGTTCNGSWDWVRQPSGRTDAELGNMVQLIQEVVVDIEQEDRWIWSPCSSGSFSTKILSDLVRSKIITSRASGIETLRNNLVPKKVEVFIWRVMNGRLPVLSELDKRGIDLHSIRCPICDNDIETVQHALFQCIKSKKILGKGAKVVRYCKCEFGFR
ncbi:uncharacterized protein [Rutidosis leptorrhynchoides]|uniref:uncharacterized protein n=1 Tax=Rutidosis leptorrhynchoides TaxID=125765 RepID=UPI003A98E19E